MPAESAPLPTVDDRPHAPPSGFDDLAADYELLGELGRGGSAVVYHARDRRLGREVALKVVRVPPARLTDGDESIARLAREARTIARLDHAHIVRVHAVRELRDGLVLEMPRIQGRTLKQLIADEGALDPARASAILGDVASALAFAHDHGVVHRDVKPENIFVDDATGRALLADFGVARSQESDVRLTQTGVTVGTPAYMSPEQIEGLAVDGRSDLYSLGLVGWEMLTGRRPWEGEGLFAVLQRQQRDQLPPVEAVRPASAGPVPAPLQYIVERLMQKAPGARWADAAAVGNQLARPVLPSDFTQWKRAHARRVAEARRGPGVGARGAALLSTVLTTMRLAVPGQGPLSPGTPTVPGPDVAAPSWADPPAARGRMGRRAAGGAILAAAVVGLMAVRGRDGEAASDGERRLGTDKPAGVAVPALAAPAGGASASPDPSIAAADSVDPVPTPEQQATAALAPRQVASERPPSVATAAGGEVAAPLPVRTPDRVATTPARPSVASVGMTPAAAMPPAPAVVAVPARVERLVVGAERVPTVAGGRHSCAVAPDGRVTCWGANDEGQLGTGDLDGREEPTPVATDVRFTQVAAGGAHSCALTGDGAAYCWGDGERGQLGNGGRVAHPQPVRVSGATGLRTLRVGLAHSCAIGGDQSVLCWGADDQGQLGDGAARDRATPAAAVGLRAVAISVGWRHSCALTSEGVAYCWGGNADGQLGDGTTASRRTPTPVAGGMRFVAIAAGAAHSCAVAADGRAFCWGRNVAGQLGTGAGGSALVPGAVDTPTRFVTVVTGSAHSCGRSAAGLVSCWGGNAYGQLGDGSTSGRVRPVRVAGGPYTSLSASGAHTCATVDGSAVCWGYNVDGQLGDGTRAHRSSPMRVTVAAP